MADDIDQTASLMTPAKLAKVKPLAAASPAAWLNQMAADAAHQHVARISELRKALKEQGKQRDYTALVFELARLGKALPKLDFNLVQERGMWSRLTGKSKSDAAEFAVQIGKLQGAADSLAGEVKALVAKLQAQAAETDLALLDLEVEYKAIEKVQDQGARWLQDMRNQLKERAVGAPDDAAVRLIAQDTLRCEILVARLKVLRAVSSAAQHCHTQVQAAAVRRMTLSQSLQQGVGAHLRDWSRQMQAQRAATEGDGDDDGASTAAARSQDTAMEAHRDLQLSIKNASADCLQLRAHENALAESVHELKAQLELARIKSAA